MLRVVRVVLERILMVARRLRRVMVRRRLRLEREDRRHHGLGAGR